MRSYTNGAEQAEVPMTARGEDDCVKRHRLAGARCVSHLAL